MVDSDLQGPVGEWEIQTAPAGNLNFSTITISHDSMAEWEDRAFGVRWTSEQSSVPFGPGCLFLVLSLPVFSTVK